MTPELENYLRGWFQKSAKRQRQNGVLFQLSFDEFLTLWGKRRLKTLQDHMTRGTLYSRMNGDNPFAYVLGWKSYAALHSGIMNLDTAQVCARSQSIVDARMKKGDRHTARAIAKISAAKKGVPNSPAHNAAISSSMKGMKRGPMSEAEKDKRRQTQLANAAAKRELAG